MSTLGDIMSTSGVFSTLGDTMSTSERYHEYIRGCSVHRWDIMMHVGEQGDKAFQVILKISMY